jgi:hypothetical protein
LPDWSGVWNPHELNLFDPSSVPPADRQLSDANENAASYLRMYPPYNAAYEARYEDKLKKAAAGVASDPTAGCAPPGFPRIMVIPYPLEFVVQPKRVTMLFEGFSQMRRIYTDGRKHPADPDLTYNGNSIGHWEGDTLVVDTVGLRGDAVFDITGAPHSDRIHIVERIRRVSHAKIEDRMVIDDPQALTKPWSVLRTYDLQPDWEITEYVCEENQRNPIMPDGSTGLIVKDFSH